MSSAKVISFINMKGGVGKTTLAVNIGYTLAKNYRKKVLMIDVDPQMNATQYTLNAKQVVDIFNHPRNTIFGILDNTSPLPTVMPPGTPVTTQTFQGIYPITENFSIIPSHLMMTDLNLLEHPNRLNNYIKKELNSKYDFIFLDSPPTISAYTRIALMASNYYIVPMTTEYLPLMGLPSLEAYIAELKNEFTLDLAFLGIILNKVQPNLKLYHDIKSKILESPEWRTKLFSNELKQTTKIGSALQQEDIDDSTQFILDLKETEVSTQISAITDEFMQKGRF